MALFYLLTIYSVIRGATVSPQHSWRRTAWYLLAVTACLLGMLTKEVMVTAPLVVLLYDTIFLSGSLRRSLAARWPIYAGMLATAGILAWVLVSTGFHAETTGFGVRRFSSWQYLCTEPGVLLMYLRLALWPDSLCFAYDLLPPTDPWQIVVPGLAVLGLLAGTVWALVKMPKIGFLAAAFFLVLAPTSSFIPILDAAFEHRMYLPLAALSALVVFGGYWLWRKALPASVLTDAAFATVLAGVTAILAWRTIERNHDYASEFTIWQDTVNKRPNNPRAHYNLARALAAQGKIDEAMGEYRRTIQFDPGYAEAYQNLGAELALHGDEENAFRMFERAIAVRPTYAEAHWNLGRLLQKRGMLPEAISQYRIALSINAAYAEARQSLGYSLAISGQLKDGVKELEEYLRLQPNSASTHSFLCGILTELGRFDEALQHVRRALELDPNSAEAQTALGSVFMKKGDDEQAIKTYKRSLILDPKNAQTHYLLGQAFNDRGIDAEALKHWKAAVSMQPNIPDFLNKLAWILATSPDAALRNGTEAVELARRASALVHGQNAVILATWAAAEAEAGQFPKAVELAERAIDLAGDHPEQAGFVAETRVQVKLYEAGVPYHRPLPSRKPTE